MTKGKDSESEIVDILLLLITTNMSNLLYYIHFRETFDISRDIHKKINAHTHIYFHTTYHIINVVPKSVDRHVGLVGFEDCMSKDLEVVEYKTYC